MSNQSKMVSQQDKTELSKWPICKKISPGLGCLSSRGWCCLWPGSNRAWSHRRD